MRVLLIDPPWFSLQGMSHAPLSLGLGYLGAYLKKNNHKCLIFSGEIGLTRKIMYQKLVIDEIKDIKKNPVWIKVLKKLSFLIKSFNPEIIGISVPTAKYGVVLELAKFLKKIKNVPIVAGGPHPTILPDEVIKVNEIDFVIRGEGEETMLDLVNALERKKALKKINGLSYKINGKAYHNPIRELIKNLDSLPFPDFRLVYGWKEMSKNFFGNILSSRGCPYSCIFCASKKIWGLKVRYRSPENILKEIKERKKLFNVDLFNFNDDTFTLNKDFTMKFCDLLIRSRLGIKWKCDTRANTLDYEMLKKMKESGCIHIDIGVECGNDKMLKYVKKGITIEQVLKAFNIAKKLGIETQAYFMMGFPEETRKDIEDAINLMKKINPEHPCWSIATPYPGTELYEMCEKEGFFKAKIDWANFHHHSKKMGFSKYIKKEELLEIAEKVERMTFRMKLKYYLMHPKRLLEELKII